ncbi:hypothetical protein Moror_17735 [Moniliophthora roreri MCA 2997]|uniref:DNA topoisomerase (ATP-hydrolyzing) n=1 Tax=Moniliophthora roreri (strain MCA 2997) TaxID=1381753 RepID=V2Z016_MONRO|nr:hypothetical protein Moror_17735 [Moniliophthora roreri MCA 2997]
MSSDAEDVEMSNQSSDSESEYDQDERRLNTMLKLENLFLDFLRQLLRAATAHKDVDDNNNKQSKSRPSIKLRMANRKTGTPGNYGIKHLIFPRKSASGSAKSISQLFGVVRYTHEALVYDVPITKRDVYYRNVLLFEKQKVVDNFVDDISASLDIERADLNVRATSKGVFCGSGLTISLLSGEITYGSDREPTLIPFGEDIESFSVDKDVKWVLVVEKDAVFQTLAHCEITSLPEFPGKGLLITGKGYPDVSTRHLVKTLSDCLPKEIPIMALVDGDAYGIDILSVYKFGSWALRHENDQLAASRIKWLGLWSTELASLGIDKEALLPITRHDEKKAFTMLKRPGNRMPSKWKRELTHMLFNRRKAEIEILTSVSSAFIASIYSRSTSSSRTTTPSSMDVSFDYSNTYDDDNNFSPSMNCDGSSAPSSPAPLIESTTSYSRILSPLVQYLILKIPMFIASTSR